MRVPCVLGCGSSLFPVILSLLSPRTNYPAGTVTNSFTCRALTSPRPWILHKARPVPQEAVTPQPSMVPPSVGISQIQCLVSVLLIVFGNGPTLNLGCLGICLHQKCWDDSIVTKRGRKTPLTTSKPWLHVGFLTLGAFLAFSAEKVIWWAECVGEGQFQAAGAGCREISCHKCSKRAKSPCFSPAATIA